MSSVRRIRRYLKEGKLIVNISSFLREVHVLIMIFECKMVQGSDELLIVGQKIW
jgi:hypothetical protein